jgi:hypothetical protein
MRIQPRTKEPKLSVGSRFLPKLERAVEREMKRFNASRSFVIAVAVADALGVQLEYDYKE